MQGSSEARSRKTSTSTGPRMVSPMTPRTSRGAERGEQEDEIRRYLQSRQLTSLITLERPPYTRYTVSVADVGDANGHAVFVFLGLGAVRYLLGLYDEMATVLGLRLICIDRWGQGQTDDVPADRRGVLEWSSVVAEVADQLQVGRFSILAHSAGAPYAMATTLMYGSRISGPVHLLAPWVSPTIESGYKWLKYVPDGLIKTAQAADCRMQAWKTNRPPPASPSMSEQRGGRKSSSSLTPTSISKSGSSTSCSTDSSLDLATALLKASHAESLRGGGSNDLLVILGRSSQRPWGFSYTDVKHPVSVWYGDKDERINMTSILWMQREMDYCSVKIVEGASHSLMTNVTVVIEALER